jgi:hypothetical protein
MKTLWVVGICLLLVGCVYEVPLATESQQEVNKALLGKWQTVAEPGAVQELLVLPLGPKEYLVSYPSNAPDGMFFRAFVAQTAAPVIMQFQLLGTAAGKVPDGGRVYHFGTFRLDGPQLVLRLINPDVVSKDVTTTDALAKAIAAQRDNPALFAEQTVFARVAAP